MFENNLENFRTPKIVDTKKARLGELKFEQESERVVESFGEGVDSSLVSLIEFLKRQSGQAEDQQAEPSLPEKLSEHEKIVWENAKAKGEIPKVRFLIDIDGVLIDTDEKIAKLLEAFSRGSFKEVIEIVGGKIEPKELRNLLRCRNSAMVVAEKVEADVDDRKMPIEKRQKMRGISLLTDRLSQGTFCFPCFNKAEREVFEEHGVQVQSATLKPFATGEKVYRSRDEDLIYYFGSSKTDQNLSRRIRQHMQKNGESPEKLIYIEIQPRQERNIL